jgi:hypothetical protein
MIALSIVGILAVVALLGYVLDPPARRVDSGPKPIKVYSSRRK